MPVFRLDPASFIDMVLELYADVLLLALDGPELRARFGSRTADWIAGC